jgi:hypothetical protein
VSTSTPSATSNSEGAALRRGRRTLLVTIVAGALALRLLHLHAVAGYEIRQPPPSRMDRWLAMEIASAIADGDPVGGWAAPYDSSPGYDYVLAALYIATGRSWLGALVVQAVLGSLVPLLLYAAGRRLHGWSVGLLAALLAAAYAPAIFYEGLLVKFALVPVVVASLLLACVLLRTWRPAAFLGGLALGVLGLLRPNMLLAAPIVAYWAAAREPAGVALRRLGWIAAGAVLVLLPMAARDRLAAARGLESTLGGIHFYMGTNPAADGEYVILPGIAPDVVGHLADAQRIAEERSGRRLTRAEVSRFWFGEGVRFVREHPGRYALLQLRKMWFALDADEDGSFGDDFEEFRELSPVLRLPLVMFGMIAPLALLGAGRRETAPLGLLAGAVLVSLLPFFVEARYRLPLAPIAILLAAIGTARLDTWRRAGRNLRLVATVLVLLLVAVVLGASDAQAIGFLAVVALGLAILAVDPDRARAPASVLDVAERA